MKYKRWKDALGDWEESNPNTLAWLHKDKKPVIAKVNGTLKMFHTGLAAPKELDEIDFRQTLEQLGEPSVVPLSKHSDRFTRKIWEWEL